MKNKTDFEQRRGDFLISTDKSKLDIETIHSFLVRSYWSPNIPREIIVRAIENSFCFGIYFGAPSKERQIGFARVISDFATYALSRGCFRARRISRTRPLQVADAMHHRTSCIAKISQIYPGYKRCAWTLCAVRIQALRIAGPLHGTIRSQRLRENEAVVGSMLAFWRQQRVHQ